MFPVPMGVAMTLSFIGGMVDKRQNVCLHQLNPIWRDTWFCRLPTAAVRTYAEAKNFLSPTSRLEWVGLTKLSK